MSPQHRPVEKDPANKLLILSANGADYADLVEAANLPGLEILAAVNTDHAAHHLCECNIILGDPRMVSEVLDRAPRLEWVQSMWAGVESLCVDGLRRDYVLTGVKDVFGSQMTEYVIAYLFGLERGVFQVRKNQLQRRWQQIPYRHSRDITVGMIGLGSIGRHIAGELRQLGLRVTGLSRTGAACDEVEAVFDHEGMEAFLSEPDYLVLSLPDTTHTKGFIDAGKLRMMKPTAVLINVGRGNTIVERDLVEALRDGIVGGAVLDVFEKEPLDKDSPLWEMPNVFVTPHHAALSFPEDISEIFIRNYHRFVRREPLLHVVDFDEGY
ncbi:MAG: D-2-hydroxyacid dehydrogenase [Xanthomonadales bacterium]|nr:D-2-hydroxyacid dehydrogenase [Xanthomonadales bacterium]